jgi:hypothetical protein
VAESRQLRRAFTRAHVLELQTCWWVVGAAGSAYPVLVLLVVVLAVVVVPVAPGGAVEWRP